MQVNGRTASNAAQKAARSLSKDKASLALELVGYDQELSSAMNYVFGNAFVCKVSPKCASCLTWSVQRVGCPIFVHANGSEVCKWCQGLSVRMRVVRRLGFVKGRYGAG